MTRDEKLRAVAVAFMRDDPKEYEGETVEEVVEQLRPHPDTFLNHAYEWFVVGKKH